jgi:microcystin-dependent protein
MSTPFVAEIKMFGCNFAPTGWAMCNGQLLPISQNTALFSLLGTYYGGDGKSTFALPDMQGNSAMHQGQGQGLSQRFLGEQSGTETVTLLISEIPNHTHFAVPKIAGGQASPAGNFWAPANAAKVAALYYATPLGTPKNMNPQALGISGSSFPHNNLMPYLVVNFCIAMQGVFPPRN